MNILFIPSFLVVLLNFPVTLFSERLGTSDAIRLKRHLEQHFLRGTRRISLPVLGNALWATLGAAAIVDQVRETKNAGPKPIDPKIAGKHGGLSRPVWKEIAQRQANKDAIIKHEKELLDKADFSTFHSIHPKVGNTKDSRENLCAEKGFDISGDSRQEDNFTGTTIYYFEVKHTSPGEFFIGLSDGSILAEGKCVGECPNSCGLANSKCCCISGEWHDFEWPGGVTKPTRVGPSAGDVNGCGLLLGPDNKLAIFFTFDSILLGKPIPISPSVHCLYPTVFEVKRKMFGSCFLSSL